MGGNDAEAKRCFLAEIKRAGVSPSYSLPVLMRVRDELFALACNYEYDVSALDVDHLSQATMRARAEVHQIVTALRKAGPPWHRLQLVATAAHIGIREGCRIYGHYHVTLD